MDFQFTGTFDVKGPAKTSMRVGCGMPSLDGRSLIMKLDKLVASDFSASFLGIGGE